MSSDTQPPGAGPGGQLLPGPLGELGGQGVRAELPALGGDFVLTLSRILVAP
jgi:hypothetical protein